MAATARLGESAERILHARRSRDRLLGADLFADPAWDMVLWIYAQIAQNRPVTVGDTLRASAIPTSTAKRYFKQLLDKGMVIKSPAEVFRHARVFLSVETEQALSKIIGTFYGVPTSVPAEDSKHVQTAASEQFSETVSADYMADVYSFRRRRDSGFPNDLFGEPAWDMLLDLYTHAATERRTSISMACLASAGPETTALRHITKLVDAGLVERFGNADDKRRRYLRLTEDGLRCMRQLLF